MAMPEELVLVRHGKSEGNVAKKMSKQGDDSAFDKILSSNRDSSSVRLVDEGRYQLELSGEWIKKNIGAYFDRYYVSRYIRAMESAAHLGLPDATWFSDFNLRERDMGDMEFISYNKAKSVYSDSLKHKKINSFIWRPPNGESLAQVCQRVDRVIDTLQRECDGKRVIIVSHGELMWAWRIRLERMSSERFFHLSNSRDPVDQINNGHIIIYTRKDPSTGRLTPYLNWMKTISPSNPIATSDEWKEIIRPRYTNEELTELVKKVPQIIS